MSAAIIIFGAAVRPDGSPSGTLRRRVDAALAFGRTLDDPLFMPTGGQGRFGPPEAEVMEGLLRGAGVRAERIRPEPTGMNTLGSVVACRKLLAGFEGAVFAASSAYHLPRCVVLLRLAGLDAHPCPPPRRPASARFRKRWYWRLREVAAVPVDTAILLWRRVRG